jgi:regulatory protein
MTHRITALRTHFRNPGLVRVYVNQEQTFTVKLIDAANLKTGQELTADRMAWLRQKHESEEAYLRSIQYLAYRPRSRREIEQYLNKKKYPPEAVAETIRRLSEARLIDDESFANWWVGHRCRLKPRSRYALRFELLQKGIDEDIISAALAQTDDSKMALALLEARHKRWHRLDRNKKRQKILAFLHRRGFRYDIAKSAYEQFIQTTGERPDDFGL